jgi:hypothetical protein
MVVSFMVPRLHRNTPKQHKKAILRYEFVFFMLILSHQGNKQKGELAMEPARSRSPPPGAEFGGLSGT